MAFNGPFSVDFRNVCALNRTYLSLLRSTPAAGQGVAELSQSLRRRITTLTHAQSSRLAAAPFMLMSLRERDDRLWEQIFSSEPELLIEQLPDELMRLRAAALGFVWQLARQNPYTLRLICGASLHWCECIAERTLVELLVAVSPYADLLTLRRADDHDLWRKLLSDGISTDPRIRRATHMCALQTVLTRSADCPPKRWAVAACKTSATNLHVADE